MTEKEAYALCDKIWDALPSDYEDAFNVLQLVVDRFVSVDKTGHNRELFMKWLEHTQALTSLCQLRRCVVRTLPRSRDIVVTTTALFHLLFECALHHPWADEVAKLRLIGLVKATDVGVDIRLF